MSRRIGKWSGGEDSSGVLSPVGTVVLLLVGGFLGSGDFCDAGEFRFRPKLPVWLKPTRTADQPAKQSTAKEHARLQPPRGKSPAVRALPAKNMTPSSHSQASFSAVQPVSALIQDDQPSTTEPVPLEAGEANVAPPVERQIIDPSELQGALSLDMLINLADSYHPRLTSAFQRIQMAEGRAVQAGLYPNPKLAASSPQMAGKESQYNTFVSQEFVTAGKLKLSVAAAQREIDQARFAWQQERFLVLTDLRQKFYATLTAQRRVEILQKLVQIAERSRQSSQQLLQAGEGARGDVLLLEIELRRAEVALKNAHTIYGIGRRQLALLVAVPDLMIDAVAGDLEATTRNYDVEQVRLEVASINPQANIARLEIDRMSFLLQRATVEPIPNIDIMGGYQRQTGIPAMDQGLFQVTTTIPLWNRNQGNIFAAQAELAGARADLQRVELQLANSAADAVATFQTASQLVSQYDTEILPKARETLELTQNAYKQGQIDFLRLLQSQKTLLEAELARIEAQEQRWVSAAALAGLLQEEAFP